MLELSTKNQNIRNRREVDLPELLLILIPHYKIALECITEDYTIEDCREFCSELCIDEGICWCGIAQFGMYSERTQYETAPYNTDGGYLIERPRLCSKRKEVMESLSYRIQVMESILNTY